MIINIYVGNLTKSGILVNSNRYQNRHKTELCIFADNSNNSNN